MGYLGDSSSTLRPTILFHSCPRTAYAVREEPGQKCESEPSFPVVLRAIPRAHDIQRGKESSRNLPDISTCWRRHIALRGYLVRQKGNKASAARSYKRAVVTLGQPVRGHSKTFPIGYQHPTIAFHRASSGQFYAEYFTPPMFLRFIAVSTSFCGGLGKKQSVTRMRSLWGTVRVSAFRRDSISRALFATQPAVARLLLPKSRTTH